MSLGVGVSANLCCPALPSLGPESSPEQLAALERKLCCLEQEKMELSRKLQGTGSRWARGVGLTRGCCRLTSYSPVGSPTAEALQIPSDRRELEQLQKEVQTLQDRLSGNPTHPPCPCPLPSPWRLACFPSTPESNLGSSPAPTLYTLSELRELS